MPFTKEQILELQKASTDFVYFVNHIYAASFDHFITGDYVNTVSRHLINNQFTMRVSARNHFKCIPGYGKVLMASGQEKEISKIRSGDFVISDGGFGKVINHANTGKKNCLRITTVGNHSIDCSVDHKIKTPDGFKSAKDLSIGDKIVEIDHYDNVGTELMSDEEIRWIGYCLAEGSLISSVRICNTDDDIISDIKDCSRSLGMDVTTRYRKNEKTGVVTTTMHIVGGNRFTRKHGINDKNSFQKVIPDSVLCAPSRQVSQFLAAFFDCDGGVNKSRDHLFITSASISMLKSIRMMLIRFGIKSNICISHNKKYKKDYYILTVVHHDSIVKFYNSIPLRCKRKKDLIEKIVSKNMKFQKKFNFRTIKSIEDIGSIDCYDIEVSDHHNFILNGFVVHNSASLYAHILYKIMFEASAKNVEAHYFSFNEQMAGYHIGKIKEIIRNNPYFNDIIDCKKSAESVLRYTWDHQHYYTLEPHGLIQFKRGIHAGYIYVDDPFQDPENELNPTIILKINEVFKTQIMSMPNIPDGQIHVIGTAQSEDDFYFDKTLAQKFDIRVLPAITAAGTALWPEWMDLKALEDIRKTIGERAFKREYLGVPTMATKAYFDRDYLYKHIVNTNLVNAGITQRFDPIGLVFGGFDIGKKAHPSALSIFEWRDGRFVQLHHKIMVNWPYSNGFKFDPSHPTQLEYIQQAIKTFKIREIYYDNTRGEFEGFDEQFLLPSEMTPYVFTTKARSSLATQLDRMIERKQIEIINDVQLVNDLCSMTEQLVAPKIAGSHSDGFWSVALAVHGLFQNVGFDDDYVAESAPDKRLRTGSRSVFERDGRLPRGW